MMKNIRFFLALITTSIRSSISLRSAFLLESVLMIANNMIFFSMWWVFFQQFDNVSGWKINDLAIITAFATGSYGLMLILFGGVKNLSKIIISGDLDPYMTQPKNLLMHLLGSKSMSKGWGHLFSCLLLIYLADVNSFSALAIVASSLISGCIVLTSFSVIVHSLPFWLGPVETLSRKYCDSLFLFSIYPSHIYSGLLKIVMFTVIPAALIGYIPVELLHHFSWLKIGLLWGSSLTFLFLAFFIFNLGLRRYESGNRFGLRL